MIFRQVQEIIEGTKTETRRVAKPGDRLVYDDEGYRHFVIDKNGRLRWRVGRDYAVVPKRGLPGGILPDGSSLRIRVRSLQPRCLHLINDAGAVAEAVGSVAEYRALWESINKKPGTRWEDNPKVWVIRFELGKAKRRQND